MRTLEDAAVALATEFGGQIVLVHVVAGDMPKLTTVSAGASHKSADKAIRLKHAVHHAAREHWERLAANKILKRGPSNAS